MWTVKSFAAETFAKTVYSLASGKTSVQSRKVVVLDSLSDGFFYGGGHLLVVFLVWLSEE